MKLHHFEVKVACLFVAACLLARPAHSQMGEGAGGPKLLVFVSIPAIQKEIGLSEENAKAIQNLLEELSQAMGEASQKAGLDELFQAADKLSGDERAAKLREISDKAAATAKPVGEKYRLKLKELLPAEQYRRLQQIRWQLDGSLVLDDPDLVQALSLTKEQQEKIAALHDTFSDQLHKLLASVKRGDPPAQAQQAMMKAQNLTKQRDADAMKVLTDEQQKKFTELKGKPFDPKVLGAGSTQGPPP